MKPLRIIGVIWIIVALLHTVSIIFWPNYLTVQLNWIFLATSSVCLIGMLWSYWDENLLKKYFSNIFVEIVLAIIVVCIIFFIYTRIIFYNYPNDTDWSKRGQFGDMFGGLNVFFTSLVFIIAYASWRIQSKELIESKKSSELNTKIAALQSYISNYPETSSKEKKYVAQQILHDLTFEYFNEEKHKHILEPILTIRGMSTSVTNHKFSPEIEFKNSGYSIKVDIISADKLIQSHFDLDRNQSVKVNFDNLEFDNRNANKKIILDLVYTGKIVPYTWKENILIHYKGSSAEIQRGDLKC